MARIKLLTAAGDHENMWFCGGVGDSQIIDYRLVNATEQPEPVLSLVQPVLAHYAR